MALTGHGFEWAKVPPILAIVLIVFGWALITIAIYQSNFFEGKSKYRQLIGNALLSLGWAILLIIGWFAFRPDSQLAEQQQTASVSKGYIIAGWHYFRQSAIWLYPYVVGAFIAWILFRIFIQPRTMRALSQELNEARQQADQLNAQLEAHNWLHSMLAAQQIEVARHVVLEEPFISEQKLTVSVPSITFKLPIMNNSLFDIGIELIIDESRVYFDDIELAGPTIVRHAGENIPHRRLDGLTIEQRLTPTEASHISSTPGGKFYFDTLIVMIKGGTRFPKVTRQRLAIDRNQYAPIQPKPTVEGIESKYQTEMQTAKNRLDAVQSLSVAYGAATQLYKQLTNDLNRDKWYPSEIKRSLEVWLGGVESDIQFKLGDVVLLTFRDGSLERLIVPDSIEEQLEWIKVQYENLDKLIHSLIEGEWPQTKIIKVKSALKPEADGGYPTALWEKNIAHPNGEVFVSGPAVFEVAETLKVIEALREGKLIIAE